MDTKLELVKDVMHKGVVTCAESLSLPEAARMMTEMDVRALVVTDDQCGLCGILAQSDLVNAALHDADSDRWRKMSVADVMTRSVLTVTPDSQISEAAKTMVQNHIHRIVVVDTEDPCTPVGVLSMGDLVRNMMRD
jgi:CBS domain-containing protein